MARRGSFGTNTSPFARAARYSDLSAYRIGGAQSVAQPTYFGGGVASGPPAGYGAGWSTTYEDNGTVTYAPPPAPERPTVAPEVGILPEPVIPQVVSPYVQLLSERQAIAARGETTGNTPTWSGVTATQFKYPSAALQAELDAIRARATATGHNPTDAAVQATYLKNLAAAAG